MSGRAVDEIPFDPEAWWEAATERHSADDPGAGSMTLRVERVRIRIFRELDQLPEVERRAVSLWLAKPDIDRLLNRVLWKERIRWRLYHPFGPPGYQASRRTIRRLRAQRVAAHGD